MSSNNSYSSAIISNISHESPDDDIEYISNESDITIVKATNNIEYK